MISTVILTKNEEKNIRECLLGLKFCDEIIVIDDNSVDKTREITRKMGAKVFVRDLNMDFASQQNFALKKAKNNWVLFIDADERISKNLRQEIITSVKKNKLIKGYYFKRKDFFLGKWLNHGESGSIKLIRLVRKNSGSWKRRVHQYFDLEGKTSKFRNPILHYPHPTISEFIQSIKKWSSWHALANKEEGKNSSVFKIIFYPIFHFIKNFIFKLGFLDNTHGFVFAVIMSFHSFLSWGELWRIQKKR